MTDQPISIGASAPVIHLRKLSAQERRELRRAVNALSREFYYRGSALNQIYAMIRARLGLRQIGDMYAVQLPTALQVVDDMARMVSRDHATIYRTEQRFWRRLPEILP